MLNFRIRAASCWEQGLYCHPIPCGASGNRPGLGVRATREQDPAGVPWKGGQLQGTRNLDSMRLETWRRASPLKMARGRNRFTLRAVIADDNYPGSEQGQV